MVEVGVGVGVRVWGYVLILDVVFIIGFVLCMIFGRGVCLVVVWVKFVLVSVWGLGMVDGVMVMVLVGGFMGCSMLSFNVKVMKLVVMVRGVS